MTSKKDTPAGNSTTELERHPCLAALEPVADLPLGSGNQSDLYPTFWPTAPEGTAAALLDAEREER